ncbi:MAG: flagellar hook-length control protein FliK, partial [Vulcanimicrobiaceae bacterium]
ELLQDPVALLRTLRIPVTPTALAFAKLVTTQPQQVAVALRALETGLPNAADGRIATLRTLAAFVGTLDPESPTFTTQITSYLSHVVEGPEAKLLSIVQPQALPAPPSPQASADPAQQNVPASPAQQQLTDPTAAAGRSAERLTAADSDLKTQLVAILASAQPETELGDAGAVVARNALTALVATQLGALASQQSQPPAWTFTIPISIEQQLYPAQIKVSRDKPDSQGEPLTGDDFHIAFILDTKRFGTVAIDLHAVQRSVSVAVRTDRPSAATTFKSALAQLGDRLQSMRYNVKSLEAGTTRVRDAGLSNAPPPSDELHAMDRQA